MGRQKVTRVRLCLDREYSGVCVGRFPNVRGLDNETRHGILPFGSAQRPRVPIHKIHRINTLPVTDASTTGSEQTLSKLGAVWERAKRFGERGFGVEPCKFRRTTYSGRRQEVRVLHIRTYLDGMWPEMLKIAEYMNGEKFAVDHERYRHPNRGLHRD